jgi:PKD repeat protein
MNVKRLAMMSIVGLLMLGGCGGGEPAEKSDQAPPSTAAVPPPTVPTAHVEDDEDVAPLLAWADSDVDEGKAPLTVKFMADIEGGKPPLQYRWTFGDGSPDSTEANPVHTYEKPGSYQADLEVKDALDDEDSDYLEIEVE